LSHIHDPAPVPRSVDGTPVVNHLLNALPIAEFTRLAPLLSAEPTHLRLVLQQDGKPMEHVYFPNGCVASATTVMNDGSMVEVATIGAEGLVNAIAFFHDGPAPGETIVQVASGGVIRMPVAAFRAEMSRHGAVRELFARYVQAFLFQAMRGTACNALHPVEQRCARWLLETRDRVGTDEFELSHEFLSIMLGVHRPTVSVALRSLQRAGFIQSRRGTIHVLDGAGLEEAACECYRAIRTHYENLGL
jgi:CRP-like cAMP-binding protein